MTFADLKFWEWGWFKYDSSLLEKIVSQNDLILKGIAEKTALDSLVALTAGLKQQVADALSGVTLPAEVQAKIDAVFTGVEANKQEVLDALSANTTP
jgi:hypothetical protein